MNNPLYKKYKREDILQFNENDWVRRTSSGYLGYDHVSAQFDESKWIYERDYSDRKFLKEKYLAEYDLLVDFATKTICKKDGISPQVVGDYLDKKYFKL